MANYSERGRQDIASVDSNEGVQRQTMRPDVVRERRKFFREHNNVTVGDLNDSEYEEFMNPQEISDVDLRPLKSALDHVRDWIMIPPRAIRSHTPLSRHRV